ncbi:MAG: hypothetical protein SGJ21_01055 [Alphaproteobacteria bacterium]|nr:hypothetical protein [Alphaproteobacteria bacterium]
MNSLQKVGGLAALLEAGAFVFGFWIYFTVLGPARYGAADIDPALHAAFLGDNQSLLTVWNLFIYVVFGALLVVLALALHERLKGSPGLASIGAAFGLIWAGLVIASGMVANIGMDVIVDLHARDPVQAGAVWQTYSFVVNGLGGGNEIVGGIWVLLVSLAGIRYRRLPLLLNILGVIVGAAGVLTMIPPLGDLGSVFGLGLILWFACLGVVMLATARAQQSSSPAS